MPAGLPSGRSTKISFIQDFNSFNTRAVRAWRILRRRSAERPFTSASTLNTSPIRTKPSCASVSGRLAALFLGLNPSTADEAINDLTINRELAFSEWNLFGFSSDQAA